MRLVVHFFKYLSLMMSVKTISSFFSFWICCTYYIKMLIAPKRLGWSQSLFWASRKLMDFQICFSSKGIFLRCQNSFGGSVFEFALGKRFNRSFAFFSTYFRLAKKVIPSVRLSVWRFFLWFHGERQKQPPSAASKGHVVHFCSTV